MTRKHWLLIAVTLLLGGLSLYLNKDWFAKDTIQIYHRSRPARAGFFRRRRADDNVVNPITFGFNRRVRLTSLKVIPVSEIQTNKYPHPIWHLTTESNSVPIKDFGYGWPIPGMHPSVKGAVADPLAPGVEYRLLVEAGDFKGAHDFVPTPKTP